MADLSNIIVEVRARREGKWWLLHMDDGGVTQVKSLSSVDGMVADYVSLMRDVSPDGVRVVLAGIDPGPGRARRTQRVLG